MKTIVNFILDKSGSMDMIKSDVIGGFNSYLKELQKQKGSVLFTLTLFDTESIETPYLLTPIKEVKPLTDKTYRPAGMTNLYDASVDTIEQIAERVSEMKGKNAVVVTIMTDGQENASHKHDQKCLQDLIKKLEKKGNWTFAFMGANQDAWLTAQSMGISASNAMSWQASGVGGQSAFRSLAKSTNNYAMAMSANASLGKDLNSVSFFAGDDKDVA